MWTNVAVSSRHHSPSTDSAVSPAPQRTRSAISGSAASTPLATMRPNTTRLMATSAGVISSLGVSAARAARKPSGPLAAARRPASRSAAASSARPPC